MKSRKTLVWEADLRAALVFHHLSIGCTFLSYGLLIAGAWNQSLALLALGLVPMVLGLGSCFLYCRLRAGIMDAIKTSILAGENPILS